VSGKNSIFLTLFVSLSAAIPAAFMQSQSAGTEILHPHTAIFMILIGLLCLSLVIDRRLRLATLTTPLYLSQRGFHSIPQSASKMSEKYLRRKTLAKTDCLFRLEGFRRLRSDIEGTQYINLLHNLAGIPNKRIFLPHISKRTKLQQERNTNAVPQSPIKHFSSLLLHPALIRMAPRAEKKISFSPGFIFVRLARGPPNLTCEPILTFIT
jgi:hypothetical protein